MKRYCGECFDSREVNVEVRPRSYSVRRHRTIRTARIYERVTVCTVCGSDCLDKEMEDDNLRRVFIAVGWDAAAKEWLW